MGSLRWRLAIPLIFLILVTTILLGTFQARQLSEILLETSETHLLREARLLGSMVEDGDLLFKPEGELDAAVREWSADLNMQVTIVNHNRQVYGLLPGEPFNLVTFLQLPELSQADLYGGGSDIRSLSANGGDMLFVAVPLQKNGARVGYLRLAVSTDSIETTVTQSWSLIVTSGIWILLAASLVGLLFTGRVTSTLSELTQQVRTMAGIDHPLPQLKGWRRVLGYVEVALLSRAFSLMANRLKRQIQVVESERNKLNLILQQMNNGVIIVDKAGEVTLINKAAGEVFGIDDAAVSGKSLVQVVRHYQLIDIWQNAIETGESQAGIIEMSAQRILLQVIAIPLVGDLDGTTLVMIQDLTQLRKLETIRQDFISNVSHELRTPLASLKALAETLLDGALDDPSASRRFLMRMEIEVDALTLMVQELLELSRIESGKVPLRLRPVAPADLLGTTVERLQLQAERAGLVIHLQDARDLPQVLVDPPRMEQVLVNLLHNAIKFTPKGGEITVGAWTENQRVFFYVKDTGQGIDRDDLERIFERFYKTDRSRSGGGTGLGLAIARHMVEAHGGKIWAESILNKGSTFYFSLPVK